MRSIIRALTGLFFLTATLASASAQTDSGFLRIQREGNEPVMLQTAIAKYVTADGRSGVEIDLVSALHFGERGYYSRLNKEFERYDAVLYELVAPEGTKPPKGGRQGMDDPMSIIQLGMKTALRLESQLELVDYHRSHFIHADLSLEGMRRAMEGRNEDLLTFALGALKELMEQSEKARKSGRQAPNMSYEELLNPTKMRRMMAERFVEAGGEVSFGKSIDQLLITDRNNACWEVLGQQMRAGKKKIAIFYGGAHMPDFDKRLLTELKMRRASTEWIDAWSLASK